MPARLNFQAARFLFACFAAALVFSCSSAKKVPYTLVPLEPSSPEASAALAETFAGELNDAGSLRPNADGSASLLDADGGERIRFYGFETEEPGRGKVRTEYVGITPDGYYRASPRGASLLTVKTEKESYYLHQFAEALFRPDLLIKSPEGEEGGRETLASLLAAKRPPRIQSPGVTAGGGALALEFKAVEEAGGGGIGKLALFYRDTRGLEFPAAFFEGEKAVLKKYREGGKTVYDIFLSIPLPPEPGSGRYSHIGVSVFNRDNSAGSGRLWAELPGPSAGAGLRETAAAKPVLHVFIAAPDPAAALAEVFSRQETGSLYRGVRLYPLYSRDFTKEGFFRVFEELRAGVKPEDVVVFFLSGPGGAGEDGDFRFYPPGGASAAFIGKWELAGALLSLKTQNVLILMDIYSPREGVEMETAFLRLKHWLGPLSLTAAGTPPENASAAFVPALTEAAAGAWAGNRRSLGAAEFAGFVQKALAAPGGAGVLAAFPPAEDFPLIDRFYAAGELRMQTMFSGSVIIEGFDAEGRPLTFGETQTRRLPPGTYAVTMTYRNGHRETKRAEVQGGRGEWVVFTYTPELLTGDFKGRLPSCGVDISELNPANYKKADAALLEKMELPPHYAAFLSGERFYRSGDYEKAIAEYTRSISLKADYTEAFVSRGNTWRRRGDPARAIADYSRALALNGDYAEVYNYRGYLYARQGNYAKAIEDYTRAVRLQSGYADAWFNRGYAYMETRDWEKAIADYTQVIKLEPSNAAAYRERALAWSNKGDSVKAAADYAEAERRGMRKSE